MRRSRAAEGYLLPENDPRIQAAVSAFWAPLRALGLGPDTIELDWRDVAEMVNAVLEADDKLAQQVQDYIDNEDGD